MNDLALNDLVYDKKHQDNFLRRFQLYLNLVLTQRMHILVRAHFQLWCFDYISVIS